MKLITAFCLTFAVVSAGVHFTNTWPANGNTPAGARGVASFDDLRNGTCQITFPGQVYWFHCETCDIIPAESDSFRGVYTLGVPNKDWQDSRNFTFLVNFFTQTYNETEVGWDCDNTKDVKMAVYSFPNNMDQNFTRSRIYHENLTPNSIINIGFPEPVKDFAVDSPNTFVGGPTDYVITNFYPKQKEVAFQMNYDGAWFSAADVSLNAVIINDEDMQDQEA